MSEGGFNHEGIPLRSSSYGGQAKDTKADGLMSVNAEKLKC